MEEQARLDEEAKAAAKARATRASRSWDSERTWDGGAQGAGWNGAAAGMQREREGGRGGVEMDYRSPPPPPVPPKSPRLPGDVYRGMGRSKDGSRKGEWD